MYMYIYMYVHVHNICVSVLHLTWLCTCMYSTCVSVLHLTHVLHLCLCTAANRQCGILCRGGCGSNGGPASRNTAGPHPSTLSAERLQQPPPGAGVEGRQAVLPAAAQNEQLGASPAGPAGRIRTKGKCCVTQSCGPDSGVTLFPPVISLALLHAFF